MAEVTDEFAPLFKMKAADRPTLFTPENLKLAARLKLFDRARFEAHVDRLKKLKVSGLREYTNEVDAAIKRAQQKVAEAEEQRDIPDDGFRRDVKSGAVLPSQANIRLAVEKLGVTLRYNAFSQLEIIEGLDGFGPTLDDKAENRLYLLIDEEFHFRARKDFFHTVISDACLRNPFHPVRAYLDGLKWDGRSRLDTLLIDFCGAADTPFNRVIGRIMMIAAVRRVRQPGCKFDEMVVLEGIEGINKSTFLSLLAVQDDWFSDSVSLSFDDKRIIEHASGKWILEVGELQGMRRADVGVMKAQISRQTDRARKAYDRMASEVPRQFIFVGTVNPEESNGYLASLTGNRRFWPVKVERIDIDGFLKARDQLWAEAAALEAQGESIRLPRELWAAAAEQQQRREAPNPFYDTLVPILGDKEGRIFTTDVWELLEVPVERRTKYAQLGKAMNDMGWVYRKRRRKVGGQREGAYVRGRETMLHRVGRHPLTHEASLHSEPLAEGLTESETETES